MYWGRGVAEANTILNQSYLGHNIQGSEPMTLFLIILLMSLPIVGGLVTFYYSHKAIE
tara:strand:+ start:1202 stop:1375 length:174 start_codon:yes stop_codon:yes gene_type:complete